MANIAVKQKKKFSFFQQYQTANPFLLITLWSLWGIWIPFLNQKPSVWVVLIGVWASMFNIWVLGKGRGHKEIFKDWEKSNEKLFAEFNSVLEEQKKHYERGF